MSSIIGYISNCKEAISLGRCGLAAKVAVDSYRSGHIGNEGTQFGIAFAGDDLRRFNAAMNLWPTPTIVRSHRIGDQDFVELRTTIPPESNHNMLFRHFGLNDLESSVVLINQTIANSGRFYNINDTNLPAWSGESVTGVVSAADWDKERYAEIVRFFDSNESNQSDTNISNEENAGGYAWFTYFLNMISSRKFKHLSTEQAAERGYFANHSRFTRIRLSENRPQIEAMLTDTDYRYGTGFFTTKNGNGQFISTQRGPLAMLSGQAFDSFRILNNGKLEILRS